MIAVLKLFITNFGNNERGSYKIGLIKMTFGIFSCPLGEFDLQKLKPKKFSYDSPISRISILIIRQFTVDQVS